MAGGGRGGAPRAGHVLPSTHVHVLPRCKHLFGRQELYQWPSVAEAGRRALGLRYRLLTYLYYHFDRAAAAGAPVARPLWFEFPGDAAARGADSQWLLGDSVLVSPVLEQARQLPRLEGVLVCRV